MKNIKQLNFIETDQNKTSLNICSNNLDTNFQHTIHSSKRASQRGLTDQIILDALDYSTCIMKQGLSYYVVLRKNLPEKLPACIKEQLANIVVILSGDSNEIITCYKNSNCIKNIKKKSKRLC